MRCPDCHKEVKFQREYCPHCSGSMFGRNKRRTESNHKLSAAGFWVIAGIN